MDQNLLSTSEPTLYQLFLNSRKQNRLANAYLLYGPANAPLKETAVYLAESLSCEKSLFSCGSCPSCVRFASGIHPDFVLIDGQFETIRKEDIQTLESKFALSALEKGHRLAYVIHGIDNITEEAANALLKFLEEPKEGQVAFLTTTNRTRVLKTIESRCLAIRVDPIDPDGYYQTLLETTFQVGKKPLTLPPTQAYLLSQFTGSLEEAKALVEGEYGFLDGTEAVEGFLNDLTTSVSQASYALLLQTSQLKDLTCYNWLYLSLDEIYQDVLIGDVSDKNPFRDIIARLSSKKAGIKKAKQIIDEAISLRQVNLSPTLVLSRMLLALKDEA